MQPNQSTMLSLGYLGLLPFAGSIILVLTDTQLFGLSGQQIFISYSAVILSFLSGILWGTVIGNFQSKFGLASLILSNVFALMAWAALLLGTHHPLAIVLLETGFIAVWIAEKYMSETNKLASPEGYQTLRNRLTIGVIVMHLILFAL